MTIIPLLDYNGINLVSLFAGMDAFSHAGKTIGTETIFHNDILPESNLILELNYGKLNHYIGDIKDLSTILSEDQKEDIEKLKILHSKEMQKTTDQI